MVEARILIVEDELIVAKDVQNMLERTGYTVPAVVSSGEAAVRKAVEVQPDLVLMDIMLKGDIDGVEAAEQIRDLLHIPVIYITAYADEDTLQRAKITEPYGYIIKPFQERELYTNIEMALYKHQMERKLMENERWLSTTLKSIGDAVITTDITGCITYVNPVASNLTGWGTEEAVGKSLDEVFNIANEETGEPVESLAEKVIREGTVVGLANHTILIAKDGTQLPVDDSAAPIRDNDEKLLGVVLVFRDITERRQAEKTLWKSEEKYRVLVENANEAILVVQDGMLKFVNPRTMEITGYSEDELTSRPFPEFIHPDDRSMVVERYRERLEGMELPNVYDFRIIDKDGNTRWLEINAVLMDWEGRLATLNFLNDITERRQMEEDILKIQKLESIGLLAGGIAHDFNNILTAILGNVSLAKLYDSESNAQERLEEAERACLRAKSLTQQLLTFSKGGTPIKKTASLSELLKDSSIFALSGSSTRCEYSMQDDLWLVEVDEGQISQVINNLVINADQAMPEGGVIRMSVRNIKIEPENSLPLENGDYVKLSIEDQGVGISEEHLQKIFDPYFTTKQRGSGLGLATSYSIIKNHDGQISVESNLGIGTTFHIYLPASPEKTLVKEEKVQEDPITGKGRILVMDDEEFIRELISDMLVRIGYEPTTALDGAEAIKLYKEAKNSDRPFDVVIMDLTVPGGMGGKEAIRRIMETDLEVKAIVSSGYSNDPIMADFRKYGFSGVIAKPYKTRDLSEILHKVITGSSDLFVATGSSGQN